MPSTLGRDRATRGRDERGIALPSVVTVLSIVAVAAAAVAFFVMVGHHHPSHPAAHGPGTSASSPATTPSPSVATKPASTKPSSSGSASTAVAKTSTPASSKPKPKPESKPKPVHRGSVPVVVFNDTGIGGLAASVGSRVNALGWRFVGAGNWSGPVPSSTVYYPPKLKAAAEQLARDLHVHRLRPAQIPAMAADRLTVILTGRLG